MKKRRGRRKKDTPFRKIKRVIRRTLYTPRYLFTKTFNKYYNEVTREQFRDYKQIPILIISYNQLFYLKQLVDFLLGAGYRNIVIIDNNSDYKPLLDYFDEIAPEVRVLRLSENYGHLVVWERAHLFTEYLKGYYAVTDADIVPHKDCPEDFMDLFRKILDKNHQANKVGFGLRLDDIPETNPHREKIMQWEKQFWEEETPGGHFVADTDTTFALYRPLNIDFIQRNFYRAIRTNWPYVAAHGGWYIDPHNLTEEQQHYMRTANASSSWRLDKEGKLIDKQYD